MVGIGGLEPPTSSLSETRSNQLSYMPIEPQARKSMKTILAKCQSIAILFLVKWCREAELNCRHEAFQASALPLSYPGLL